MRENLLINEASQATYLALKNDAEQALDGEAEREAALAGLDTFTVLIWVWAMVTLPPCSPALKPWLRVWI